MARPLLMKGKRQIEQSVAVQVAVFWASSCHHWGYETLSIRRGWGERRVGDAGPGVVLRRNGQPLSAEKTLMAIMLHF